MDPMNKTLVAIVDDDDLFRRSVERLIGSAGFSVETFGSAEDFLERGKLDATACAILDIRLPGLNGFELQRQLVTRPRSIPIVFVSAHDDPATRANATRAGAIAFLKKPFDNSTLLEALHRALK